MGASQRKEPGPSSRHSIRRRETNHDLPGRASLLPWTGYHVSVAVFRSSRQASTTNRPGGCPSRSASKIENQAISTNRVEEE